MRLNDSSMDVHTHTVANTEADAHDPRSSGEGPSGEASAFPRERAGPGFPTAGAPRSQLFEGRLPRGQGNQTK